MDNDNFKQFTAVPFDVSTFAFGIIYIVLQDHPQPRALAGSAEIMYSYPFYPKFASKMCIVLFIATRRRTLLGAPDLTTNGTRSILFTGILHNMFLFRCPGVGQVDAHARGRVTYNVSPLSSIRKI